MDSTTRRLNIGPIPTIKLDWLQPHEGNIVDFLFRARAFQNHAGTSRGQVVIVDPLRVRRLVSVDIAA